MTERLIPTSMQRTYGRAMVGKSRGAAIKAFCQECCGYDRFEVSLCTDTGCPLYLYRPYRSLAAVKAAKTAKSRQIDPTDPTGTQVALRRSSKQGQTGPDPTHSVGKGSLDQKA